MSENNEELKTVENQDLNPEQTTETTEPETGKGLRKQLEQRIANEKKLIDELNKYKEAERLKQEEELKAKGEFEKLLEAKEKEIAEIKSKAIRIKTSKEIQSKLSQFNLQPDVIDLLEEKALSLVEYENDEPKNLDDVINVLSNNYSSVFNQPKAIKALTPAPTGNPTQRLTEEQWLKLPTEEKDKALKDGRYQF